MNLFDAIKQAVNDLNSTAQVLLLTDVRAEAEELNHEGDVIVLKPDWTVQNQFNQAFSLVSKAIYNIDFKTSDEFDNSDNSSEASKIYDKNSVDKIADMAILASSVFAHISRNEIYPLTTPVKWSTEPILRAGNGTMTGVRVRATVSFEGRLVCNFSK